MNGRWLCVWLLTATPSHSDPPGPSSGFMRMDELEVALKNRLKALEENEEFDAKRRPKRLIILLQKGVKTCSKRASRRSSKRT